MSEICQLCPGGPRIACDDSRAVWIGSFYLEWGRCCNDVDLSERLGGYPVFVDKAGVEHEVHTAAELWELLGGDPEKWCAIVTGRAG